MVDCPLAQAALRAPSRAFLIVADATRTDLSRADRLNTNTTYTFAQVDKLVAARAFALDGAGSLNKGIVLLPVEQSLQSMVAVFAHIRAGALVVPVDSQLPEERLQCLKALYHRKSVDQGALSACLGIFTSGSSGDPKLVLHSWETLQANAKASNQIIPLLEGDKTLLSLPLYHIGGFAQVLRAVLSATSLVLAGRVESPSVLLGQCITHTSMVSTQLQRLLTHAVRLPQLKSVLIGGGPIDKALIRAARQWGIPLMPSYGMSETASQVITEVELGKQRLLGDTELKLNTAGELCVRSSSLFLGYWGAKGFEPAGYRDGWFATGDLARFKDDQWQIIGRVDNQFISGGKNIQPEEIEKQLALLPGVKNAIVVPVPDAEFGTRPFAFISRQDGLDVDADFQQNIVAQLKKQVPGYLVPRLYAQLPDTRGIKIKRQPLIALAQRMKPQ
ncbi:O-succinylbenzoic acid--CoA ligase [Alteromonadaceae bacterium Bs31]|nr:O-succinylbenzoic acid--CoA ligase [Alteromonadaceae bacterium Bs31]